MSLTKPCLSTEFLKIGLAKDAYAVVLEIAHGIVRKMLKDFEEKETTRHPPTKTQEFKAVQRLKKCADTINEQEKARTPYLFSSFIAQEMAGPHLVLSNIHL